jgi:hypothetical protein
LQFYSSNVYCKILPRPTIWFLAWRRKGQPRQTDLSTADSTYKRLRKASSKRLRKSTANPRDGERQQPLGRSAYNIGPRIADEGCINLNTRIVSIRTHTCIVPYQQLQLIAIGDRESCILLRAISSRTPHILYGSIDRMVDMYPY